MTEWNTPDDDRADGGRIEDQGGQREQTDRQEYGERWEPREQPGPAEPSGEPGQGAHHDHGGPQPGEEPHPDERTHSWPCAGPAELDLAVDVGRIEVALAESTDVVEVRVRAEHSWGGGWHRGLSGLLSWLGGDTGSSGSVHGDHGGRREFSLGGITISVDGRGITVGGREFSFGGPEFDLRDVGGRNLAAEAVREATVTWSDTGRRLVARSPVSSTALPLRLVPLVFTVRAPARSRLTLSAGAGQITVTGPSGTASARTGSGDITLDQVDGDLTVRTGSGATTVRSVSGRTQAKTGSGTVTLDCLGGPGELESGSGDLRFGAVRADLRARTGSGDLTVADAEAGRLDLTTGSGSLRAGVHAGVAAELDLRSGSGRARSELDVSSAASTSQDAPTLRVLGRTGSGDVLVTRALSPAGAAG